jgi:hypothetical protein
MDTPYGQRIIIMAEATWVDFGTRQEKFRDMLKKQDTRIKELLAENAMAQQIVSDANRRLENIRELRRDELRTRIEQDIVLPGDEKFVVPSKRKN